MSAIQGPKFVLFGDGGEEESVTIDKYDPEITMPEWKVDLDSHSSALHKVIKVTESLQERRDIAADMTDLHRTTETDQVWFMSVMKNIAGCHHAFDDAVVGLCGRDGVDWSIIEASRRPVTDLSLLGDFFPQSMSREVNRAAYKEFPPKVSEAARLGHAEREF